MRGLIVCIVLGLCAGCGEFPRDPERTSQRVEGGILRVGVVHDPPFVMLTQSEPVGSEVELIRGFAEQQGARIVWNARGQSALMEQLERWQLDAAIGGHAHDSPWLERVAFSRPYALQDRAGREIRRVVALPPGENAWAMRFDRYARHYEAARP